MAIVIRVVERPQEFGLGRRVSIYKDQVQFLEVLLLLGRDPN
jgi:hypothetical protein